MQETMAAPPTAQRRGQIAQTHEDIITIDTVSATDVQRFATGSEEFDRVLGGGLVAGSVVLIGGDPGIGKSTLLLQALVRLNDDMNVLYVTGEESVSQVAMRAQRLGVEGVAMPLLAETELERIAAHIDESKPAVVVIDSIQTVYSSQLQSAPGSVSQVRECAGQLTRIVNELGVFAMTDRGLRGVSNPSALFLSQHERKVSGSCVLVTQEGTRPMLVEIQALVDAAHIPNPRRLTVGLDGPRLAMLLAVLSRHAGITCFDQDVFVNAVGGVRISEPAADVAVLLAIVSSIKDKSLPSGLAVFGEVGLAGEIRPAPRGQERLREAAKLGFGRAIVPKSNMPKKPIEGLEIIAVQHIDELLTAAWEN